MNNYDLPIVMAVSAQSDVADAVYLDAIEEEQRVLQQLFDQVERFKQFRYEARFKINKHDLRQKINDWAFSLLIFHFAGHADGHNLYVNNDSVPASGLSNLLGLCPNLKLVFLNGCDTQEHIRWYQKCNIPAIIATTRKIEDKEARDFAEAFYFALLEQHRSLKDAFYDAIAHVTIGRLDVDRPENNIVNLRSLGSFQEEEEEALWPIDSHWRLYILNRSVLDWKIDYGFNLPDLPIDKYKQVL